MHLQVGGGQKPISRLVLLLLLRNGSNTAVPPPQPTLSNKYLLYNEVYQKRGENLRQYCVTSYY